MKSIQIYSVRAAILFACLIFSGAAFADVKIKVRQTSGGQTSEYTTYIKGKRERVERVAGGVQTVNVTQCDTKRSLQIMPAAKTYFIDAWQTAASVAATTNEARNAPTQTQKGGVVTSTITTKDTGERKKMFGYTARHIIVTTETVPSPDACRKEKTKMEIDGWYIDAEFALDCQTERYANYNPNRGGGGCQDRYETKQTGAAVKTGYPVYQKMTVFDASGNPKFSSVTEVVELSSQTLDAALFDVPANFREVKNSAELYASTRNGGETNRTVSNNGAGDNSDFGSGVKSAANSNASAQPGAKQPGVVRIGLAQVKTAAVGEGLNAAELAAAIQNTLGEYLKAPNVELVALEAKLPSAVDAEAKQKECDYVVYATVSHKKGGGGFGMFGKALGTAVAQTGGGAWGDTAANVAGAVAVRAITAATLSQNVKSKDEITLDVKLVKGGAQVFAKQYKQKAKGDGDDIITRVVEQAAEAIVGAAK